MIIHVRVDRFMWLDYPNIGFLLFQVVFVGFFFGAFVWGAVCDVIGRKMVGYPNFK